MERVREEETREVICTWTKLESGLNLQVMLVENLCVLSGEARALLQQRVWEAFGNSIRGLRDYKTSVWPK